ncbi:MAG: hypothetical protein P8H62_10130 [Henriciella sp.]|nr:hypothetical protein [Henriciella sp.]
MRLLKLATGVAIAAGLAGCMSIPKSMTVAEYCGNPSKANENVCRLKVEIDGNSTALADTNMSLNKARMIADTSLRAAAQAQATSDAAMNAAGQAHDRADRAYSLANAAMLKDEDLVCNTRTVQKSAIGTCQPVIPLWDVPRPVIHTLQAVFHSYAKSQTSSAASIAAFSKCRSAAAHPQRLRRLAA